MRKCEASNRNYERCLLSGPTSTAQSELENQYLCPAHAEEYRLCYIGYKDLQRRLEEQRYPEQPSVGGTGRVKAMPVSTAEILACKQLKVLQSLQQYYRERHSLLKRIIDTRKLVMKRFFHVHDKDWGHRKAIQDLQVERNKTKDLLYHIEKQLHNFSLPAKKRGKLGKWVDAVKDQIESRQENAGPNNNATGVETKQQMFMRPMEPLMVQIAPPEEESDPLAAELAARRQELLGDFWFFLKYRFQLQFEQSNDFFHLAACIFRRIVLATPGALILTKAHSSIRSFLEDESINIDILQDLWDVMQESPPRLIWDAIADYRTFFNTQFEEQLHEVLEAKKLFILGGYVHLEDTEIPPSSSPEVSWAYLISLSAPWYPLSAFQALARSFREALILKQLMYLIVVPQWSFWWDMLEKVKSDGRRVAEQTSAFSDIIIVKTSGSPPSHIRIVPSPPGYGLEQLSPLLLVDTESRPQVFFQIGIDDPYALPLIEEFKKSPHFHAIWAKNAKTGEVVCTPSNQQLWTKRMRWAPFQIGELQRGIPTDTEFIVQETLAEYLAKLEAGDWETIGLTNTSQRPTELISRTYRDYYLVLIISLQPCYGLEMLMDDLWIHAGIVRDQLLGVSNGRIWQGDHHKMIELLNSHPFFRDFCREHKLKKLDQFVPRNPSIHRTTGWPKEAYKFLGEVTKIRQSVLSKSSNPLPTPGINWEHYWIDCRILTRKLEVQGVIEIDTSTDMNISNIPLGFGFHIPTKGGLYVEFAGSNHPQTAPRFTCATLRPSKLALWPDDTIVRLATKYQHDNPNASFTFFFLRSESFHWPFKFEKPLPYWFQIIGSETRVYTTRYLLKDAPGSDAAVHGYMNHAFMSLEDCIIWRDVILCLKPNSKAKIRISQDFPQRRQGSIDLVKDLESYATRMSDLWEKVFCRLNIAPAGVYANRKVTASLRFEVLRARSVAEVRETMDMFLAREWE